MTGYSRVIAVGNVTRDITLRYTPGGTAVADVGLAINEVRKGQNGEKIEEITFVDITCWGRTAEIAGEYLRKGSPALFEGRLKLDTWSDKATGEKKSRLKLTADKLLLLGSKQDGQQAGGQGGQRQQPQGNDYVSYDAAPDDNPAGWQNGSPPAEDIPF